jgi:hypothetical protein
MGLVIGIVAIVVLVFAGIVVSALSKNGNNNPSVNNPATEASAVNNPDIDISGEWNGKLDQPGNGVYDMTLIFNQGFSGVI